MKAILVGVYPLLLVFKKSLSYSYSPSTYLLGTVLPPIFFLTCKRWSENRHLLARESAKLYKGISEAKKRMKFLNADDEIDAVVLYVDHA